MQSKRDSNNINLEAKQFFKVFMSRQVFPKEFLNNIGKTFNREKNLPTISQWILED